MMNAAIKIVLVEPSHPGNIGAAARAMKNMGFSQLALVKPKEFPSREATARATGADDVLNNACVYNSLDDAISDCHFVAMTTARVRHAKWQSLAAREAAKQVYEYGLSAQTALVFGPERTGLTNEHLDKSNCFIHIPTTQFSSLNLAMAVNLICYEVFVASQDNSLESNIEFIDASNNATTEELEGLFNHYHDMLNKIDFFNGKAPEKLMRKIRYLYQKCHLEKEEVYLLRGILSRVLYQLKNSGKSYIIKKN